LSLKNRLPDFILAAGVEHGRFTRWLNGRVREHRERDRKREGKTGKMPPKPAVYREIILNAVIRCGGRDEYTGERLDWEKIGTWNNSEAQKRGAPYKRLFRHMPTVDHAHEEDGLPRSLDDIRICSWEINDAKGDLSLEQFEALCRRVLNHKHAR
jgi:hypothetical protein